MYGTLIIVKTIKKNIKTHDCGIVAAYNSLIWCKKPQTYETIEYIASNHYNYDSKKGIIGENFEKLVKHFGVPIKGMPKANVELIQSSVYMGKAILLTYKLAGDLLGHLIMIVLNKQGKIRIINGETRKITWDELASDISAGGAEWFFSWELPNRDLL